MDSANQIQITIAVILIFSFLVAAFQIVLIRKQMLFQYTWMRMEKALDYSLSRNRDLQKKRKQLDKMFGSVHNRNSSIPLKEIEEKLSTEPTAYTVITTLLAHWENLALAIECGVVDEDVAFEMTAGLLIDYVKTFHDFIEHRKTENNPRAYSYLIELALKWEIKLDGGERIKNVQFPKAMK